MLCVTEAPVRLRKYGASRSRWASLHVPGNVATTSVFAWAADLRGHAPTPPSAAEPARKRLRVSRECMPSSSVSATRARGHRGWRAVGTRGFVSTRDSNIAHGVLDSPGARGDVT